jgi:hypothetical protein
MDFLERSAKLRSEADRMLQEIHLQSILQPYRPVFSTGSYFLDVMVYPDIDLYIPLISIEQLFRIGGQLACSSKVFQVKFEKSFLENLPGGLYLNCRVEYGDWERPWKLDIWSLDEATLKHQMEPMLSFKNRLTAEKRAQIIRYKMSILTEEKRTPRYSGYFIYKAFLDECLNDPGQVTAYLIANGIKMN